MRRLIALLFAVTVVSQLPACAAANARATDAAFGALLNMEKADAGWGTPMPDDFSALDEAELVAYLARQQKAGADINAYRHFGTLLHHAIRANQQKAARWLLEHGADPRLAVTGTNDHAMALALKYKRAPLVKLLQEKYGMEPAIPPAPITAYPPAPAPDLELAALRAALQKKSVPELEQALAAMSPESLHRKQGQILEALRTSGSSPATPELWRTLWRLLPKPIDYSGQRGLAGDLTPALWPELFASGYSNTSAEYALGCSLQSFSAEQLKENWSLLEDSFTDFRVVAPRLVLAGLLARSNSCQDNGKDLKAKLALLPAKGIRSGSAFVMPYQLEQLAADVRVLAKPYLASYKTGQPRIVEGKHACRVTMSEAWWSQLVSRADRRYTVQTLEIPGEQECALLLGVYTGPDFPTGRLDRFEGPELVSMASCVDVSHDLRLLRNNGGTIQEMSTQVADTNFDYTLVPVRDNVTGKRYYLQTGEPLGRCASAQLPDLFEWQRDGESWKQLRVEAPELLEALASQCLGHKSSSVNCEGFGTATQEDLDKFLRRYGALRYKAYQDAVLKLERDKLAALENQGIPSSWIGDALLAVGKSKLPLEDKRRRIAYLFRNHKQLMAALNSDHKVPTELAGWLPAPDWVPLIKLANENPNDGALRSMREVAGERGLQRVGCDMDNARGLVCGEKDID